MRREVYTHSVSHAHFLCIFSLRGVQTSRTRMAQGVCVAHVISHHLTFSLLMFHPPSLLFPHGHFDTSFPCAPSSPNCSRSEKRGSSALPHERRGVWLPGRSHVTPLVMSPKSSTRLLLQTVTRRLSTIRTTITSPTSQKKHTREHWTVRCSHNV